MQVKDPIYTKLCNVHLCKFIVLSTVVVLVSALCCDIKMTENCDKSEKKRARKLIQKQKQRQRAKMQPPLHEVCGEINEYKREDK